MAVRLEHPTSLTPELVADAKALLRRIWRPGFRYRKAAVVLMDLAPERPEQGHLFRDLDPKRAALMAAVDAAFRRFGPGAVRVAGAAASMAARTEGWQMDQQRRSPAYTTSWAGLREVSA